MQVYSPSMAPGSPVMLRFRGMTWAGARGESGEITPDEALVALLFAGGWSMGRLVSEADLTSLGADEPFSLKYRVRQVTSKAAGENTATRLKDFVASARGDESCVMEWTDHNQAVVLDIDVHGVDCTLALSRASAITPAPYAVKQSKGGGLHCLYIGAGVHSAAGLAALAAFSVETVFPQVTGIEVLTRCRCSPTGWLLETSKRFKPFSANSYTVDTDEVQEYLNDKALHVGSRYGHAACPFAPGDDGPDMNPSVSVTPDGIRCFRCDKFAGWASLLYNDTSELPPIWRMARARIWWDQVSGWCLYHYPHLATMLKEAYRAALVLMNGSCPEAYRALTVQGLIRARTGWYMHHDSILCLMDARHSRRALDRLPSLYRVPRAGEEDLPPKSLLIANLDNLYTTSTLPLPDVPPMETAAKTFKATAEDPTEERWAWYEERANWKMLPSPPTETQVGAAWDTVEQWFPAVDRKYLQLLIIAHLVAREGLPAQPLILAVTGCSGGGKTCTARLAGALVGGQTHIINADARDFNLQFGSALLSKPPLLVVDEFLKRESEASALAIYELGQYYNVTMKYQNPVVMPVACPVVLTGISLGQIFRRSAQFLRRVVRVELNHACNWKLARAENLLETWNDDPGRRRAADIICSDLAYKFIFGFDSPTSAWQAATDLYGMQDTIDESSDLAEQITEWLILLDQYAKYSAYAGRARYSLSLHDENPAVRSWLELCDGPSSDSLYRSSRIQERDLGACLGLDFSVVVTPTRLRTGILGVTIRRGPDIVSVQDLNLKPKPKERT